MSKDDFDVLTHDERIHLERYCIHDLAEFVSLREWQIENLKVDLRAGLTPGMAEPCWECREIAKKLGVLQQELKEAQNV